MAVSCIGLVGLFFPLLAAASPEIPQEVYGPSTDILARPGIGPLGPGWQDRDGPSDLGAARTRA